MFDTRKGDDQDWSAEKHLSSRVSKSMIVCNVFGVGNLILACDFSMSCRFSCIENGYAFFSIENRNLKNLFLGNVGFKKKLDRFLCFVGRGIR